MSREVECYWERREKCWKDAMCFVGERERRWFHYVFAAINRNANGRFARDRGFVAFV